MYDSCGSCPCVMASLAFPKLTVRFYPKISDTKHIFFPWMLKRNYKMLICRRVLLGFVYLVTFLHQTPLPFPSLPPSLPFSHPVPSSLLILFPFLPFPPFLPYSFPFLSFPLLFLPLHTLFLFCKISNIYRSREIRITNPWFLSLNFCDYYFMSNFDLLIPPCPLGPV